MMFTHIAGSTMKCYDCGRKILKGEACLSVPFTAPRWSKNKNLCEKCLIEHARAVHLHNAHHNMSMRTTLRVHQ